MSIKGQIKLARGSHEKIINLTDESVYGEPLFDKDRNYIYVGDGKTDWSSLPPVTTNKLEGYWADKNNYKIDADEDGIFIRSYNNVVNLKKSDGSNLLELNNSSAVINATALIGIDTIGTNSTTINIPGTLQTGKIAGTNNKLNITATDGITVSGTITGTITNAQKAENVTITNNNTTNNAIVNFSIGTGTYSKTLDNIANANNVTSTINGKSISNIFESNGTTVKTAQNCNTSVNLTGDQSITGVKTFNSAVKVNNTLTVNTINLIV